MELIDPLKEKGWLKGPVTWYVAKPQWLPCYLKHRHGSSEYLLSMIFIMLMSLIFRRDKRSNVILHPWFGRAECKELTTLILSNKSWSKLSKSPDNPITPSKHQPPRPVTATSPAKAKTQAKESEHISGFGSYRFFSHALEHLGPPSTPCKAVGWLPPMHLGVMHPENK